MIGIVFASHGGFAQGLKETVEMFAGEMNNCHVACLFPGVTAEEYEVILEKAIDASDSGDGVFVFTDIASGTPYNRAVGLKLKGKDIEVFGGANVSMVIEQAMGIHSDRSEAVKAALANAAMGIIHFEPKAQADEDDDF